MAVEVTPADVTMGAEDASGDHDVKVTITSDDDAHKTAEVELSVACTEDVEVEIATAKKDAAAGMAEWKGQSVGETLEATVCTYTAKALEKEATGTFTVNAAEEAANTPAINLAAITAPAADSRELTVSFAPTNTATNAEFTAHSACAAAAPADAQAVLDVDGTGVGCTDEDSDNTYECTVKFAGTDLMCAIVVKDNATPNANMEFKPVTLTVSLTATL